MEPETIGAIISKDDYDRAIEWVREMQAKLDEAQAALRETAEKAALASAYAERADELRERVRNLERDLQYSQDDAYRFRREIEREKIQRQNVERQLYRRHWWQFWKPEKPEEDKPVTVRPMGDMAAGSMSFGDDPFDDDAPFYDMKGPPAPSSPLLPTAGPESYGKPTDPTK